MTAPELRHSVLTPEEIARMLPHRHPFLFVDRIVELDPGKVGVGIKNVTMTEPQFAGHFPGHPVMPGLLIAEGLAQLAGIVATAGTPSVTRNNQTYLAGVRAFKFTQLVRPGDTLVLYARLSARFGPLVEAEVWATVRGETVATGHLSLVERPGGEEQHATRP